MVVLNNRTILETFDFPPRRNGQKRTMAEAQQLYNNCIVSARIRDIAIYWRIHAYPMAERAITLNMVS